ncbi:MAG: tetratricopeptide repeat protein [Nitrospirae bacterium]|nr:tetratricopeptide repeat protein [Nitrospirota bacterium]
MKKVALVMVLLVLFAAAAGAAVPNEDKDFKAGLKSYNSRNYNAAVKYFKEYIHRKPDPTAYYLIGYSLYKLGKFSEADENFRDAYLIDPEYSLEKVGLIKKGSGEVVRKGPSKIKSEPASGKKEAVTALAAETRQGQSVKQPEPAAKAPQPASADTKAAKPGITVPADQKAKAPEAAPAAVQKSATPVPSAPQQAEPPKPPQTVPAPPVPAAPAVTPMPMPKQMSDAAGPGALIAMVAALGMILVFIGIAFYVYYSLCLFLIAKKLDVPAPWTAWIPIVQIWTFVVSAGKPGWWILLFLVPIVNLFLGIYLWMCVTENLGKNKWLGLLILVPLLGFLYPGWLAFSKSEHSGGYTPPEEPLAE